MPDAADVGFDLAPISLWLEDYSGGRAQFEVWRGQGVRDLRAFLLADPARIKTYADLIRVSAVNRRTLALYDVPDFVCLLAGLDRVFRDDMLTTHVDELVQLWDGQASFSSQTANYTLTGRRLDILLNGTVLPGPEHDWAWVQVVVDDVTEREAARRARAESDACARGFFDQSPVSLWVEDFSVVKRRSDVVGVFPNDKAVVRLVGALMLEQNDEWAVCRRHGTLEGLRPVSDYPLIKLPSVAA